MRECEDQERTQRNLEDRIEQLEHNARPVGVKINAQRNEVSSKIAQVGYICANYPPDEPHTMKLCAWAEQKDI